MADPKNPKTPVAQPRMVEITMVASFPSPWKGNQALEIAGMKKSAVNPGVSSGWAPSTDDFNQVAEADVKDAKTIFSVGTTGEMIGAMQTAKPGTLSRVNLITHSSPSILPLAGTVDQQGGVFFTGVGNSTLLNQPRIDTNFIDFLNGKFQPAGEPDGKTLRTDLRALFRADAEFFFYGCDGGQAQSFLVMQEWSLCLGIAVHGFVNFIDFQPLFDEKKGIIVQSSRANARYQDKAVKDRDANLIARGFRHLVPDKNLGKPATPSP